MSKCYNNANGSIKNTYIFKKNIFYYIYKKKYIFIYMLNKETYNIFIWSYFLAPMIHKAELAQLIKNHE